jgi:hypothetical protein
MLVQDRIHPLSCRSIKHSDHRQVRWLMPSRDFILSAITSQRGKVMSQGPEVAISFIDWGSEHSHIVAWEISVAEG